MIVELAADALSFSSQTVKQVAAQAIDASPNYQISSWAHPAAANNIVIVDPARVGAYVIDARTGKIWVVKSQDSPKFLGPMK